MKVLNAQREYAISADQIRVNFLMGEALLKKLVTFDPLSFTFMSNDIQ